MALKKVNSDWLDSNLTDIAEALRDKGITSGELEFTETSNDMADAINGITKRDSSHLSANGRTVSVPAGYYANAASKSVSSSYVIPSGTKTISASGTTNVSGYANASVADGVISSTASFNSTTGVFTASAGVSTEGYVETTDTASETYSLTLKDADDLSVSARTVTVPAGYYPSKVSKSVSSSYVIPSGNVNITSSGTHNVSGKATATVDAGSYSATAGATAGSDVSASGTNITLTEVNSEPSSGYYITATGTGSATASATASISEGYIETGSDTDSATDSDTTTRYYTIATETGSATPSSSSQTITPSSGKLLSSVTVGAIPSGYIQPSGTKTISSSGTHNVTSYAYAKVAAGSAKTPATTISVTPSISVSSSGKITASIPSGSTKSVTPTVSTGYVSSGTAGTITVSGSNTKQLTTNSGGTYTPGTSPLYPAYTGDYMTGNIIVAGDSNLVSSNIKQGVSIFGVAGSYLGYSLSGTWELNAVTVHDNYHQNPAISASGLDYELQYGPDGVYVGSTLKLDASGLWGDGTDIIWSGHEYAWMGEISGNSYPTAYITFNGSYNVSEKFYNAFTDIATQTSSGGGGGSDGPDIETSTVTINAYGSDPYGYSGNTYFYYTAYENGAVIAKQVSSNVANNVTLNNVVVGTYLIYDCAGSVSISPTTGGSWVEDFNFTGSRMSQIFKITGASATFSGYSDCCFEGTSQILLADGTTKNLSEISIGEKLITYNEQTGVNEINEVTALGTADVNHNTIIVLEDDTIIQMNKYHPLWTEDGWKSIVRYRNLPKLTEADKLMNTNGDYVAIKSIEEVEIEKETYYTIKVANNNNFYVNGYLAQGKDKD